MPGYRIRVLLALLSLSLLLGSQGGSAPQPEPEPGAEVCVFAPPTPHDPNSGLPLLAPRAVPAEARCPVCGMFPARAPHWAAQVVFDNGDTQFFDSPLSLLIYLQDVGRYTSGRHVGEIAGSYVRATQGGGWLLARDAIYVQGSTLLGPMRAGNLPAFVDRASAQRFAAEQGGALLTLQQITPQLLARLDASRAVHRHGG
ncbi:nitrous oxide reductase accessory protein NosL [Paucibacter sp. PLA-PC-4]|uniref:nitrous oxide reductase accessory protein NosL n=1 Tax=Paucibacter sp. PLA-PC-4 TaxID=2993655 RepID=UPI00224B7C9A|nr:nitrous oxide reductase accessory protein NosL [Paucibacter sp. PLA-PC-4]MCX2865404.1 nitrous oxide reductase accessory protein NosL [Paucibacter sp. PLA-PC-4]